MILLILLFWNGKAQAHVEVVSVQSIRVNPYEHLIRGFRRTCNCDVKRLVISELNGIDLIKRINEIHPDVILAIGQQALVEVKKIKHIPIVYLMVFNPESILNGEKNISGIGLNIPMATQLNILLTILPECKKISMFYNPRNTQHLVKSLQTAASNKNVELVAREVNTSKEVLSFLNQMKTDYDVFWILPDATVVTPETTESFLIFSIEKKIPLLAFSKKYVEWGAMISIGVDDYDLGSQAGELTQKLLSRKDKTTGSLLFEDVRKPVVVINALTAKKLGIDIDRDRIRNFQVVE